MDLAYNAAVLAALQSDNLTAAVEASKAMQSAIQTHAADRASKALESTATTSKKASKPKPPTRQKPQPQQKVQEQPLPEELEEDDGGLLIDEQVSRV
jgi:hypothetical protein